MFLLILEEGEIRLTEQVSDDDLEFASVGLLQIVNLNTDPPTEYWNGEWREISAT